MEYPKKQSLVELTSTAALFTLLKQILALKLYRESITNILTTLFLLEVERGTLKALRCDFDDLVQTFVAKLIAFISGFNWCADEMGK